MFSLFQNLVYATLINTEKCSDFMLKLTIPAVKPNGNSIFKT